MRRTLLITAALLTACSGAGASATTTTVPPSSTAQPMTIVPGGLIAADPATLVPYEDAEPLVVGERHDGVVSPNGKWAAIASGGPDGEGGVVTLIDLDGMIVVASETGSGEGLVVDDDGNATWFDEGRLRLPAAAGEPGPAETPPTPRRLSSSLSILDDGRIVYLSAALDGGGPVSVVIVEPGPDLLTTVYEIPTITSGIEDRDPPQALTLPPLAPAVAWDEKGDRALVVSTVENLVVEVDLSTGEMVEHDFASPTLPEGVVAGREVFLGEAGSHLLVASRVAPVGTDADRAGSDEHAADLVVIDTADWSSRVVERAVWSLFPSADGDHVAGLGASWTGDAAGDSEIVQGPVYLIDAETGLPLVGFEGRSGVIVDVQFSGDGAQMYVISEGGQGTNIDIVDVAAQGLAGSLGFERISLIGEAGLLAFHPDGG